MELQILIPHNVFPYVENKLLHRLKATRSTQYGHHFTVNITPGAGMHYLIDDLLESGAAKIVINALQT